LKYTRQLIDAIHDGTLKNIEWENMAIFGLQIPKSGIKDVPQHILRPEEAWVQSGHSASAFKEKANYLAGLFNKNFKEFEDTCSQEVINAGPKPE
jgi:phosphoenolpyruvate carboxykinase (ATP)